MSFFTYRRSTIALTCVRLMLAAHCESEIIKATNLINVRFSLSFVKIPILVIMLNYKMFLFVYDYSKSTFSFIFFIRTIQVKTRRKVYIIS